MTQKIFSRFVLKGGLLVICLLSACLTACLWDCNSANSENDFVYLPLDDSEYPYANLPRLVIQTENAKDIRNRDTKVHAKLQIYGKDSPETNVLDLTIRGRGNSSWGLSKYSYKLKFKKKISLFGMPADKDWDLLSNQRDKSLVRNWITFELARSLNVYAPRSEFVEVFLNHKYQGIFQLTEHIKVSENRVDISKNSTSFLFEKQAEDEKDPKHVQFFSNDGKLFSIQYPKEPSDNQVSLLKKHIDTFDAFLTTPAVESPDSISKWIDLENLIRYYLIQEFSKNLDGNFHKSVFITWEKDGLIQMGPVWDFDLAYGNGIKQLITPYKWFAGNSSWYKILFKNENIYKNVRLYWAKHHAEFVAVLDSVNNAVARLAPAAKNEYKRWPILGEKFWVFNEAFKQYEDTADSLNAWIKKRIAWMDEELLFPPSDSLAYR